MCGIAGIHTWGAPLDESATAELATMNSAMATRGPDGEGLWVSADRQSALAHRRLAIIDLRPEANQPMESPEHGLTIVFNGEIYNYRELRASLCARGYRFRSQSDTEVLLVLYAEYGENMCERLQGMYTFAICDERRGTLYLARDPFGIKPLYVAENGTSVRFASQVKPLLLSDAVDKRSDPAAQVGFHLWGSVPEPYTMFRGIRALEPGSWLSFDRQGRKSAERFCSISKTLEAPERDPSTCASREKIHATLLDSVRKHLIADVPVATFLSSGADSQLIAHMARESGHADVRTLTIGFEEYRDTPKDEVPLAEASARKIGAIHTTRIVHRVDFANMLDNFFRSMDQPTIDGFNVYCVSKVAAEQGLKVCLSGVGGDELFGGYDLFEQIPKLVRGVRRWAPFPAMGKAFRIATAAWIGRLTSPKFAGLFDLGRSLEGAYLLRRGLFMPWELPKLLPPEVVREGWGELQPLLRIKEEVGELGQGYAGIACLEMRCYLRNQLLRDADWAGMAHSLEIRTPLVDIQLLRDMAPFIQAKHPLRKPRVLSSCGVDIEQRPKTGFNTPVSQWFQEQTGEKAEGLSRRGLRGWGRYTLQRVYGREGKRDCP